MAGIRGVLGLLAFAAGGIAAVIVGAFMLRGAMHMWDSGDGEP